MPSFGRVSSSRGVPSTLLSPSGCGWLHGAVAKVVLLLCATLFNVTAVGAVRAASWLHSGSDADSGSWSHTVDNWNSTFVHHDAAVAATASSYVGTTENLVVSPHIGASSMVDADAAFTPRLSASGLPAAPAHAGYAEENSMELSLQRKRCMAPSSCTYENCRKCLRVGERDAAEKDGAYTWGADASPGRSIPSFGAVHVGTRQEPALGLAGVNRFAFLERSPDSSSAEDSQKQNNAAWSLFGGGASSYAAVPNASASGCSFGALFGNNSSDAIAATAGGSSVFEQVPAFGSIAGASSSTFREGKDVVSAAPAVGEGISGSVSTSAGPTGLIGSGNGNAGTGSGNSCLDNALSGSGFKEPPQEGQVLSDLSTSSNDERMADVEKRMEEMVIYARHRKGAAGAAAPHAETYCGIFGDCERGKLGEGRDMSVACDQGRVPCPIDADSRRHPLFISDGGKGQQSAAGNAHEPVHHQLRKGASPPSVAQGGGHVGSAAGGALAKRHQDDGARSSASAMAPACAPEPKTTAHGAGGGCAQGVGGPAIALAHRARSAAGRHSSHHPRIEGA